MSYKVQCERCQADINVTPSRFQNRDMFFCGKKCEGMYKKTKCTSKIKCHCVKCEKEMFLKKSEYERRNKKGKITCSRKCSDILKKDIYQGRDNPNCKYPTLSDDFFKEIDSEEKAYILGWIASDGHVARNGAISIEIKNIDGEILEKMRDVVCRDILISKRKNKDMIILRFCSKTMAKNICKWLKISPGKKDSKVKMPNLKNKLKWHFLRGFFDGDGTIRKRTKGRSIDCGISTNSKSLRSSIERLSNLHCWNNEKSRQIVWSGNNARQFLDRLYSNANIYMERKYKTYLSWK